MLQFKLTDAERAEARDKREEVRRAQDGLQPTERQLLRNLKNYILDALDALGGVQYLIEQGCENPKAFLSLLGRLLPHTIEDGARLPIEARIEVVLVRPELPDLAPHTIDGEMVTAVSIPLPTNGHANGHGNGHARSHDLEVELVPPRTVN